MNPAVNPKLRIILAECFTKLLILLYMGVFLCSVSRELGYLNYKIMLSPNYRLQLCIQDDSTVKHMFFRISGGLKGVILSHVLHAFPQIFQPSSLPFSLTGYMFFWEGFFVSLLFVIFFWFSHKHAHTELCFICPYYYFIHLPPHGANFHSVWICLIDGALRGVEATFTSLERGWRVVSISPLLHTNTHTKAPVPRLSTRLS